ncbi:Gfo/Idh/MocA family protein [Clostridium grantii]|uniref:Predicted dehydrogenase n=1 Tax=Clostridium grantii DSM 8605 TaxID=1121316 RepID=A0A1M5T3W1_9CLOT|nr:Gfo/Idh/MocA family oxidoreductase [Clostridium grantii]SHH45437.1 Predicted dehydrogenase [Clostridium grantii DSM 8605]
MEKLGLGIIGCGNISDIYLKNCKSKFPSIKLIACSDLDMEKAEAKAKEYDIKACTVEELLANDDINIVLNITTPQSHRIVCEQILKAGKHVYVEKPLSLTKEDGKFLVDLANEKGLKIGCAPDTFLGGGIQTCAKLIEDGWIGEPIAATAFLTCHGHESWHPDPEFYYKVGGGPMFDMGPYYLTALISLLGPVDTVAGYTKKSFETRTITSEKKCGQIIDVEVPTHINGLLRFKNGAIGTLITSFDVWGAELPRIEIYGTKGSLSVPDPNTFGGPVKIRTNNNNEFVEMPLSHGYAENSRGLGIADMAEAIINNTNHKANGDLAYHVLDIMHAFHEASDKEEYIKIESTCLKPEMMKR